MKCSASPTICTAPDPLAVRALAARFEGMLLAELWKPLAAALGPMGDLAAERVAESVAAQRRGGFTDALAAMLAGPAAR